jgi:thioredoxin-related protein
MKIVQETEQKVLISIKSPTGHLCDTFDSDMMACIPFLDMQANFDFEVDMGTEDEPKKINRNDDGFRSMSDEELKDIIENKQYGRLAF